MPANSLSSVDRWAHRTLTTAGFLAGGVLGLFEAPEFQSQLRVFGVDQLSFKPAAPIIVGFALVGAWLAHTAGARARRSIR